MCTEFLFRLAAVAGRQHRPRQNARAQIQAPSPCCDAGTVLTHPRQQDVVARAGAGKASRVVGRHCVGTHVCRNREPLSRPEVPTESPSAGSVRESTLHARKSSKRTACSAPRESREEVAVELTVSDVYNPGPSSLNVYPSCHDLNLHAPKPSVTMHHETPSRRYDPSERRVRSPASAFSQHSPSAYAALALEAARGATLVRSHSVGARLIWPISCSTQWSTTATSCAPAATAQACPC